MSKAKKQRILYKQDANAKAAELEEFLFGNCGNPTSIFDRETEEAKETVAELVKQANCSGGLLHNSDIFFEDTRGGASCSSSDDEDHGNDDADGGQGGDGAVQLHLQAASDSDDDAEEDADDADKCDAEQEQKDGEEVRQLGGEESDEAHDDKEEEKEMVKGQRAGGAKGQKAGNGKGADSVAGGRAPVWQDPDDTTLQIDVEGRNRLRKLRTSEKQTSMDGVEYEAALRKQHQSLNPRTSWAKKRAPAAGTEGDDDDDTEAAALLARAGGLTDRRAGRLLPPGQIETTRLKDANQHQPSEAVVQAVRFHPNAQVLLTAGLDKKLRLFQVDGLRNPLIQAVHLDDMPITHAEFAAVSSSGSVAADADRVVLAGRRPHFYIYDMGAAHIERVLGPAGCQLKSLERFAVSPPSAIARGPSSEPLLAFTGDGGFIPLVSLRTRQWVANLKMSGNVRALAFSHDGGELYSTGDDGVVHVWDLRTRRCRLAFADLGNVGDASSLALSPDSRFIATGAKSGVVNVYRRAEVEAAAARADLGGLSGRVSVAPSKELLNLTTDVDTLAFSPDSQMLAMASRMKQDALRLVHLPSLTVFANWPTGRSPLHYVHSADFSPHCGFLTIGNAKGRALLYRLHHYQEI